jgi:putative hydrolase of the HAD superfamily
MVLSELEHIMRQKGASYHYMFNDLVDRLNLENDIVSQMVQIFIDHKPCISCYPGVHTMLARMRKQFKLGILTDGRLAVQQRKIQALGLETEVDEILCSDMMGLEKPASELFEWFENKIQIYGRCLMYVGDNLKKDFYGANLRNWNTVCVFSGETQNADCETVFKPCHSILSILDLERLLISDNLS